jgi:Ca2+/H+ antiporter
LAALVQELQDTVKKQEAEIAHLKAPDSSVIRIPSNLEEEGNPDRCMAGPKDTFFDLFVDPSVLTHGQLLIITALYGYLLFTGGNMIGDGSELLLLVPSWSDLIGSVVLPVLGAVPDGLMVLFSGLGANAAQKISVGIGALAGSTIMLLTIPWFLAIYGGRVDIVNFEPQYRRPRFAPESWCKLTPGNKSWQDSGVGVTAQVGENAGTMMLSCLLYLVMQIPAFYFGTLGMTPAEKGKAEALFALVGFFVCVAAFCFYLYVQMKDEDNELSQAKAEDQRVAAIRSGELSLQGVMAGVIDQYRESGEFPAEGQDLSESLLALGEHHPIRKQLGNVLIRFYAYYDINRDHKLDIEELRCIMSDLHEEANTEELQALFLRSDADNTGYIEYSEFVDLMLEYLVRNSNKAKDVDKKALQPRTLCIVKEDDEEDDGGEEEEDIPEDLVDLSPEEQQARIKSRAFTTMGIGTLIVTFISDPMTDCLAELGVRLGVSPFYIAFVLAPLASNAAELIAAYNYALKKTCKSMTISLCALEGAAVMNNTFPLRHSTSSSG